MPLSRRAQLAIQIRAILPNAKCHMDPCYDMVWKITVNEPVRFLRYFTISRQRTLAQWHNGRSPMWECYDRDTYERMSAAGFNCVYTPPDDELAELAYAETANAYDNA